MGVWDTGLNKRFEEEHAGYIEQHLGIRSGERARRLQEGHGHAEKLFLENVWWLAIGNFENLHPEYEVVDYKDGFRYLDFAYLRPGLQLAIEIDGYGPHMRHISRVQFSDQCRRQNDLVIDGWKVLRYSYDDVKENPRFCQQKLQQFMGRWLGQDERVVEVDWEEKEIIRLFLKSSCPVTPTDLANHFGVTTKTARVWLHQMLTKKWIQPVGGSQRIRAYKLNLEGKDYLL
ncbi:hypothetical protein SAMN04488542_13340 [Fontibacillus panacisegetis]|uniref:DNA-binding response regulator n=1 Tax=Fontibacillus panacisegetis TaxID=670482 RepID=A0A1G7T1X7_9BACL|nr:endonuclease domain-containing protein [Fontibacillus panacisegetis]SDG29034.1 hypothetical protein SAMN04488542_13340 [Fontibacillus panacisegetis]